MPLYKLSHTDEITLEKEKESLLDEISTLKGILSNPDKLNRVLCKDLKEIAEKYGDDRRTQIIEKEGTTEVDKRELIAKEDVMIAVTRDGYVKRSTMKSYRTSGENVAPGIKDGDALVSCGLGNTIDYLIAFTSLGNYVSIPVHKLPETKWKDEGVHLNQFATLQAGEKIVKAVVYNILRNDLYLAFLSKFGQIKRMCIDCLDFSKHSKPVKCMKLLTGDEIVGVECLTGNSDILILSADGRGTFFNENELTIVGAKAGGVKSMNGLNKTSAACMLSFDEDEYSKIVIFTDKASYRIIDTNRLTKTQRLGKAMELVPSFKYEKHLVVAMRKIVTREDVNTYSLYLSDQSTYELPIDNYFLTDVTKNAKKNIDVPAKVTIVNAYSAFLERIDAKSTSHPIIPKERPLDGSEEGFDSGEDGSSAPEDDGASEGATKDSKIEQISIFDDLDE